MGQANFARTRTGDRAIAGKIRRIRSLEHRLENTKDRRVTYSEASSRIRKKAVEEINQIKLGKRALLRKLTRLEKKMQHRMKEMQSGKYKSIKILHKFEKWRSATRQKWRRILRDAE